MALAVGGIAFVALGGGCNKGATAKGNQDLPYTQGGVDLANPARAIVSLAPSCTEVLCTGGASSFLVGRTASCNYPDFVKRYPIVAGVKPDWEKIATVTRRKGVSMLPDLIVYDPSLYNADDIAMMKKYSKMPPFALDGDTVDQFLQELRDLSALYSGETFMSEYVDKILAARKASLADPVTPTPTVALILPGDGAEHYIAGVDSFFADEIKAATGKPVGPAGNKFVVLNAESLLQMNPDIVVTAGDSASFTDDQRFKTLAAIKNKRVIAAPQDAMLRRGSRVDQVIAQLHNSFSDMMNSNSTSTGSAQ